mgnify:CR=1 FL=1
MEQVKRKVNGKFMVYPLYTIDEAEIKNVDFVHWKDVEVGRHILINTKELKPLSRCVMVLIGFLKILK